MMEALKALLTDPEVTTAVIAAIVATILGIFGVIITKIKIAKPEWEQYKGYLITAVKFIEASIPDDTVNSGAKKLDRALQMALALMAKDNIAVSSKLRAQIKTNIPVIHDILEAKGTL